MQGFKINGRIACIVICTFLTGASAWLPVLFGLNWLVLITAILAGTAVVFFITASIKKSADKYSRDAAVIAQDISKGKFTVLQNTSEQDELSQALAALSAGLKKFTDDLSQTAIKQNAGNSRAVMDEKSTEGAFRESARNLNAAYNGCAKDMENITANLLEINTGDLRNSVMGLPGDRAKIGAAVDTLANNIKLFLDEIQNIRQAVSDGRLSYKAEQSKFTGNWARAAGQLNEAMYNLSAPLSALRETEERLARGDFSPVSDYNYRGDFNALFQSLGKAAGIVAAHNKEMLAILDDFAGYTPGRNVRREYGGAFQSFKPAVSGAAERLEKLSSEAAGNNTTAGASNTSFKSAGMIGKKLAGTQPERASQRTARAQLERSAIRPVGVQPEVNTIKPTGARPEKLIDVQGTAGSSLTSAVKTAGTKSAAPSAKERAANKGDSFVSANPTLGHKALVAPSAAKVYDAKDFGKY